MADEECKFSMLIVNHVGPGHIAFRQARAARPAQAGEHGGGQILDRQAAVGVTADKILRLFFFFRLLARFYRKHGTEHAVRTVGGQAFEAGFPGAHVEILEFFVGVIGRHVDGLRNRGVNVRRNSGNHIFVSLGRDFECGDKVLRQVLKIAAHVLVEAPGVVFDGVFLERAVGHAFFAAVGP